MAASRQTDYRPDIDGLRAVAVLLVILGHAFPQYVPGGFIGVDIFFVISGYLITSIILKEIADGEFSILRFYQRRIRRIFPALILVSFVTFVAGWFLLWPREFVSLGKHLIAGAGFSANLLLYSEVGYFDAAAKSKPLLHLWSLGVEEQFYIVWPLFLLTLARFKTAPLVPIAVLLVSSLLANLAVVQWNPAAAFYLPFNRGWELAAGALLVLTPPNMLGPAGRTICGLAGVAMIVAATAFYHAGMNYPGSAAILPVAGAVAVISANRSWFNDRILANRVAVWIGLISYPLYLWHWPLQTFARADANSSLFLLIIFASFVLAWLTYRFVEWPIRFGKFRRYGALAASAGMASVAFVGAFVLMSGGVLSRFDSQVQRVVATTNYEFSNDARALRCWLPQKAPFSDFASECRVGSTLIWGDLYAARLYPALPSLSDHVAQFTRDGCEPLTRGSTICAHGAMLRFWKRFTTEAKTSNSVFSLAPRSTSMGIRVGIFGSFARCLAPASG